MAGELAIAIDKYAKLVSPEMQRRMLHAGGRAAKTVANNAARPLSNARGFWARKPSAGYDFTGATEITMNHRPAQLWSLMDSGRKGAGPIYPQIGGRKNKRGRVKGRAVVTPSGPRARSSYGSSRAPHRGLIRKTFGIERRVAVEAAHKEFERAILAAVSGR